MKKIGVLIGSLPPETIGGAEIQAEQLARFLSVKYKVLFMIRSNNNLPRKEKKHGYVIKRRKFVNLSYLCMIFDLFSALREICLDKANINLLLCYNLFCNGLIGVVAKGLFHIPTVIFIRGEEEYVSSGSLRNRFLAPFIFRFLDSIIVQSKRMKRDLLEELHRRRCFTLEKMVKQKIHIVPNAVQAEGRRNPGAKNLVYVGRLTKKKGVEYLISAMKSFRDVDLIIVGDGPDRQRLEKIATGLRIQFVGTVLHEKVWCYLKQAKILILPSLHEGLPNVVLEAMSLGVPVIATKVGSIPEIVRQGETGFLVQPGSVDELSKSIKRLIEDDDLQKRLSSNCLKEMRKYSWENAVRALDVVIEKTLQ